MTCFFIDYAALEGEYSSQSTNKNGAVSRAIVGVKDELNVRSDSDIARHWEVVEQFQIGLSCVANLAFDERLTNCDTSHCTFLKQVRES